MPAEQKGYPANEQTARLPQSQREREVKRNDKEQFEKQTDAK